LDVQALATDIRYNFQGSRSSLADYLPRNPVTGLLIARDDRIPFEHYQYGRTDCDQFISQPMAIWDRYPEAPPYGEKYPEFVPHLTIADRRTDQELDRIAAELEQASAGKLPISAVPSSASLTSYSTDRPQWRKSMHSASAFMAIQWTLRWVDTGRRRS
jgi:hypothetical protein